MCVDALITYVCVFVSLQAVWSGQHFSAPAASSSRAVITTYQRDRPARVDTGTHNPHWVCLFYTWTSNTPTLLLHCFPLAQNLSGAAEPTRGRFLQKASPIATKEVLRLQELRQDPGNAGFQIVRYVWPVCQEAQCDMLKEVEKIKRSVAREYFGQKPKPWY